MLKHLWNRWSNHVIDGSLLTVGFEPIERTAAGTRWGHAAAGMAGWKPGLDMPAGHPMGRVGAFGDSLFSESGKTNLPGWGTTKGGIARGMGALAIVGSAANLYMGYQEDGIKGMFKAGMWDLAVSSAVAATAYSGMGKIRPGFAQTAGRYLGAALGATAGGAALGTPGAFAGAYLGAAPLKVMGRHPLLATGAILALGAAGLTQATVKGGYEILKQGHRHSQMKRTINTSGDLSAFMTQGAQTMRARAVSAIHKSHNNARSALGQEASFLSMGGRNYHSKYR